MGRTLRIGVLGLLALAVLIQLVPYGRDHSNPPSLTQVRWDSPSTKTLFENACADCHSYETVWPWYSNLAPVSWLVQHDVDEGRDALNVSTGTGEMDDLGEVVLGGSMPPSVYTLMHPIAKLTRAQQEQLVRGLEATFGLSLEP